MNPSRHPTTSPTLSFHPSSTPSSNPSNTAKPSFLPSSCQEWKQIGGDIDGEASHDNSGISVSMSSDGGIVTIGATYNDANGSNSGHVRVYELVSNAWQQIGADIDGEASSDESGYSVSMSSDGKRVAIGAPYNDGNGGESGHVRVYELVSDAWQQVGGDIDSEAANDSFGFSVSMSSDGGKVAIGGVYNDARGSNSGHVRVYELVSDAWQQVGGDIDGEATDDHSGKSVSMSSDGRRVAIGATHNDGNGDKSGHVRVYELVSDAWQKVGGDIDGEAGGDQFGFSVSMSSDGRRVAIGANFNDANGGDSGHVRVYEFLSNVWQQVGGDIDGEAADDRCGYSVSMSSDGEKVAIGAQQNGANRSNSGHVRVYKLVNNAWQQVGGDIDGEAAGDRSGTSVSMSSDGKRVAIGAQHNDGNGSNSGHVRVYEC